LTHYRLRARRLTFGGFIDTLLCACSQVTAYSCAQTIDGCVVVD
jgi:hypothetical protein